jgi:hypothetical protein
MDALAQQGMSLIETSFIDGVGERGAGFLEQELQVARRDFERARHRMQGEIRSAEMSSNVVHAATVRAAFTEPCRLSPRLAGVSQRIANRRECAF